MSHKRNEALRHVQHSMHHVIAAGEGSDRAPDSCKLCPYYRPDFKFRTCLYAHCPYKKQVNVFRSTPEKWDILKKIVLFPVSLFVAFLALMAKWLLTLSSYVVAPLMLYIFGCGIYTAYRQTWDQFFILLVAEFICFVLFFGATAITEDIGRFSEWLAEL